MELGEYLATLRKGWLVIAVLGVLCGGLGYAQAASSTPIYRSSSTVYVTLARGETVSELNQGATYAQNLVTSFVQLATMPAVLEPVIEDLGLDVSPRALKGSIQADSPLNTSLIEIAAVSTDPQRAADLANGVAASLAQTVADLSPTTEDGAATLKMTVVAEAGPSSAPFSPKPRRDAAAGAGVGLVLGVLVALLRAQLDTRVRTVKDLPGAPARVALGQVPLDRTLVKHPRTVLQNPHSTLAESYRRLAANLQFLDASRPLRTIVVSSSIPGEGKSTTAVNLAIVMAEKRGRVLLVDADLRSPSVAGICGLEGGAGLSTVLGNQATVDDVVQEWGVPGLHVITAGQVPPNPSQLVDSAAMDAFLATVSASYDLVVLDTPPLLALTDGAVLARKTDGAVVVARSKKINRARLAETLASLDALGATCLGLLLNGVPTSRAELRYGYGSPARRRGALGRRRARHDASPAPTTRGRRSAGTPTAGPTTTATAPAAAPTSDEPGRSAGDDAPDAAVAAPGARAVLADGLPADAHADAAPADAHADGAPGDADRGEPVAEDAVPADDALDEAVPRDGAPDDTTPDDATHDDAAHDDARHDDARDDDAPEDGGDGPLDEQDDASDAGDDGLVDEDVRGRTHRHVAALSGASGSSTSSRVPEGE